MLYRVQKYPFRKIVWLDTGFVITMAGTTDARAIQLKELLKQKVRDGAFFVLEGDEAELQMRKSGFSRYMDTVNEMSYGMRFNSYAEISGAQFLRIAEAFI